jgi:phosphatidylserine decarboxylase
VSGPAIVGAFLAVLLIMPLAWKWELGLGRVLVATGVIAMIAALAVSAVDRVANITNLAEASAVVVATFAVAAGTLAYRFYRDPERSVPQQEDAILSPADGTVVYVRESRAGMLPVSKKNGDSYALTELTGVSLEDEDAVVIGIAMSFLDVHVNRCPIGGDVTFSRHVPGGFGSLKRQEMIFANERATTLIRQPGLEVAVVQIASRLVRRIAVFVNEGDAVERGQRLGVIKLGSQVDLVLPRQLVRVTVTPGQRVRAGESIVALSIPTTTE